MRTRCNGLTSCIARELRHAVLGLVPLSCQLAAAFTSYLAWPLKDNGSAIKSLALILCMFSVEQQDDFRACRTLLTVLLPDCERAGRGFQPVGSSVGELCCLQVACTIPQLDIFASFWIYTSQSLVETVQLLAGSDRVWQLAVCLNKSVVVLVVMAAVVVVVAALVV